MFQKCSKIRVSESLTETPRFLDEIPRFPIDRNSKISEIPKPKVHSENRSIFPLVAYSVLCGRSRPWNPNQKPGPTNCILNSPKSCFGVLGSTRGNMEPLSESNFGLGISEIFEFRSIGNPWNFVQKPWSFGQTSRILEHFWNVFGNLGISVHFCF